MANGKINKKYTIVQRTETTQNNGAIATGATISNGLIPIGFKPITLPSDIPECGGYFVLGTNNNFYFMTKLANGTPISNKNLTIKFWLQDVSGE